MIKSGGSRLTTGCLGANTQAREMLRCEPAGLPLVLDWRFDDGPVTGFSRPNAGKVNQAVCFMERVQVAASQRSAVPLASWLCVRPPLMRLGNLAVLFEFATFLTPGACADASNLGGCAIRSSLDGHRTGRCQSAGYTPSPSPHTMGWVNVVDPTRNTKLRGGGRPLARCLH